MMTMLHSVWSGGGSAAGRRRSLLALGALLALVASVLVWAAPTQAQGTNQAPTVIILPITLNDQGNTDVTDDTLTLNGSFSFDPDDGDTTDVCAGCTFKWEILTASYRWLVIADSTAASTTVPRPNPALTDAYGSTIEFRLTVTDGGQTVGGVAGQNKASASATETYSYPAPEEDPTASISVSATLEDPESDAATEVMKWTVDGVIDGPGENGNADNEWDIMEGTLLVLDGSGSSDTDGRVASHAWALVYQSSDNTGVDAPTADPTGSVLETAGTAAMLSTDDTGTADVVETVGELNVGAVSNQSPYYAIYTLTVTDNDGNTGLSSVRIVIHDQPADPKVSIGVQGDVATTPNLADGSGVTGDGTVQIVAPPATSGKYLVPPVATGGTATSIVFEASATDADGDTPTLRWQASGGVAADADLTAATLTFTVPANAEEGDSFTLSVTATDADRSAVTATASVTVEIATNTLPVATILTPKDATTTVTDPTVVKPTNGVYTITGFGFDPDGGNTVSAWTQLLGTPPALTPAEADDDGYVELTGAFSNTVSFNKPTDPTQTTVILSYTVIDEDGAFGSDTITVTIAPDAGAPTALSAGDDQVVAPDSTVILTGTASGLPTGVTISTWAWSISGLSTSPDPGLLTQRQSNAVHKSLLAFFDDANNDGILNPDTDTTTPGNQPEAFSDADASDSQTDGDGWPLRAVGGQNQFQFFTSPKLAAGLDYAQIEFILTATASANVVDTTGNGSADSPTLTAKVKVTVSDTFFASYIDGPDFCYNQSLGGPVTRPHDSDGDGTADVCSLPYTRREAVARQNALEQLAELDLSVPVTDAAGRTSDATLWDLVRRRSGDNGTDGSVGGGDDTSEIIGTCTQAKKLAPAPDDPDACDDDATEMTSPPDPIDPADAATFYSGVVSGPDFCANHSLGGARTFAHDSDVPPDGVADVCSLHTTRREAVARQLALEKFSGHDQFENALKAACTALGSETFGESASALAGDACSVGLNPMRPNPGTALPS